jgi:tetratricopeptide (TPR) repeat protein
VRGRTNRTAAVAAALLGVVACVGPLERGEALYRQGDLRGAVEIWRSIPASSPQYAPSRARLAEVDPEFERRLRRYEKRATFFESQERLAEAILYYRLAHRLDPERHALLDRVQELARLLARRSEEERAALEAAMREGRLHDAREHAELLATLDPFDPSAQIEVRQARAAVGAEVLHHIEAGQRAYAAGDLDRAQAEFRSVLALDPSDQVALGHLAYLRRLDDLEPEPARLVAIPSRAASREEILAEGHYRAGRRAAAAGDPFRALVEYANALRVNSGHADARAALERQRAELRPRVDDLYQQGKRYFQDEDLHNALRVWRQVLLIDPANERTRENVERAERILSRLEEIQTGGS